MAGEANEVVFDSIRNDLAVVGLTLKELAGRVIDEEISSYPLFIASQEFIDLGKPIFDRDVVQVNWFYNVSFLEDFLKKGLIKPEKVSSFKRTWGDPTEKACVFVITEEGGQFIFVPFDPDGEALENEA